jgi:hypothetical protein
LSERTRVRERSKKAERTTTVERSMFAERTNNEEIYTLFEVILRLLVGNCTDSYPRRA